AAREAARRMQCTNHLKQIGIAVHNFHDTQKSLPPVLVANNRLSIWGLIMPYVEQVALYDFLTEGNETLTANTGFDRQFDSTWWHGLNEEQKKQTTTISYYRCPTRRGSPVFNDDTYRPGPLGDYFAVVCTDVNRPGFWQMLQESGNNPNYHVGPFRVAMVTWTTDPNYSATPPTYGRLASWTARDTLARFEDGTSNTVIFGERHIPLMWLGECVPGWNSAPNINRHKKDCSFLSGSGTASENDIYGVLNSPRSDVYPSGKPTVRDHNFGSGRPDIGGTDPAGSDYIAARHYAFGSLHPGVFNTLFGDGSILTCPVTYPPRMLLRMSEVNDGQSIEFP
ncbi:MAG: DUF1559 domain-containing protein, partial [Planctomycetaceae bacterium]|nr:DUF1559 domain-containing protein [Planctomycetaceae bacterium]